MKLNIYTIYDTASGLYCRPFYDTSDGAALRNFTDIALGDDHPVASHPEDYSLFRIGIYNDTNAEITIETRDCLSTALEAIANSKTPLQSVG